MTHQTKEAPVDGGGLKPCPFCGSEATRTGYGMGERAKLQCVRCEATGPVGLDGEAAAQFAWNRRPQPNGGSAGRVAELEGVVREALRSEMYGYDGRLLTGDFWPGLDNIVEAVCAALNNEGAAG